jgi:hypothetical protein
MPFQLVTLAIQAAEHFSVHVRGVWTRSVDAAAARPVKRSPHPSPRDICDVRLTESGGNEKEGYNPG